MLRIGEFSKLSKISIKALRYYDKVGLLKPAMIDSATQYRYYTLEQLETIRLISMYKEAGLSIEMISSLIYKKGDKRALLGYQKQVLTERAAELKKTNPQVGFSEPDYCCVIYPDDGYRESNIFVEYAQSVDRVGVDTEIIKFKEIEPITAISVIHRGIYDHLRDAYLFAVNWATENGYEFEGEPRERYIHGAWDRTDESEWVTELQLPVKEK